MRQHRPEAVALLDPALRRAPQGDGDRLTTVYSGTEGLLELVRRPDIVIGALAGFAGLAPTIEALKLGATVAPRTWRRSRRR